jgi:hypothetical protein
MVGWLADWLAGWLAGQASVTDWQFQYLQREVKFDKFLPTYTGEM